MSRPKKARTICAKPEITEFIKIRNSRGIINITVDEYETLRLIDYMGLTQNECAMQMHVARSTIAAIYENARYKISDSIVNGKSIKISGGDYIICQNYEHCCKKCFKNTCGKCNHGSCEYCTGVCRDSDEKCFGNLN